MHLCNLAALAASLLFAATVAAQPVSYAFDVQTSLRLENPVPRDNAGAAVSISGDRMIVGVPGDGLGATSWSVDIGSAYIYVYDGNTWIQEAKLTASDGSNKDRFGSSVAILGDRILVGAPGVSSKRDVYFGGAVYVFERDASGWREVKKLRAPWFDSDATDVSGPGNTLQRWFGSSVALSDNRIIVGDPTSRVEFGPIDDRRSCSCGAAYLFEYDGGTWSQMKRLTPPGILREGSSDPYYHFGISVSVSDDRVLIGADAIKHDDSALSNGAAYVFVLRGGKWGIEQILTAAEPGGVRRRGSFGRSVSLSGERALVGVPASTGYTTDRGYAHVFALSGGTWRLEATLEGNRSEGFGNAVALRGDRALVGQSYGSPTSGLAAYVFQRTEGSWILEKQLSPGAGSVFTGYGAAVALSDRHAVVGAPLDDHGRSDSSLDYGAAYVYGPIPPAIATTSDAPGWRMLSAPIKGLTVGTLTAFNLVSGVPGDPACADAPANLYTGYTGGGAAGFVAPTGYDAPLTPGRGFFWYFSGEGDAAGPCGVGSTASSIQPLPLVLSAVGLRQSFATIEITADERVADEDVFYLVGNPFSAGFDLEGSSDGLVSIHDQHYDRRRRVAFQNTVQIWDPGTGNRGGGYITRTARSDGGKDGSLGTSTADDIAVWQGFWIERTRADAPADPFVINFDGSYRRWSDNGQSHGTFAGLRAEPEDGGLRVLRFELTGTIGGQGVFDGAASVLLAEGAGAAWDAYDASKLNSLTSPFALIAPVGQDRAGARAEKAAESRAYAPGRDVAVPLALSTSGAGTFELTWPERSGFPDDWTLTLEDRTTGQTVDLRAASRYAFTAGATSGWEERFVVHIGNIPVANEESELSGGFVLGSITPNPARARATLMLQVAAPERVRAEVFDLLGRRVLTLPERSLASGTAHTFELEAATLAAGTYLVRVAGETFVQTRRLTVVR